MSLQENQTVELDPAKTGVIGAYLQEGMVRDDMTFGKAYPGALDPMREGFGNAVTLMNEAPSGVAKGLIQGQYTPENNARYPGKLADMLLSEEERAFISTLDTRGATVVVSTGENPSVHSNGALSALLSKWKAEGIDTVVVAGGTADNGEKFTVLGVVSAGMTSVAPKDCIGARADYHASKGEGQPTRFDAVMKEIGEAGAIVVQNATDIRWTNPLPTQL